MSKSKNSGNKLSMVVGIDPTKFQLYDKRLMKPVCHLQLYFKQSIFKVCSSPFDVIKFFHDVHADENKTNSVWPWLEGAKTLPTNPSYNSQNFEVVGNVYEGIYKKL